MRSLPRIEDGATPPRCGVVTHDFGDVLTATVIEDVPGVGEVPLCSRHAAVYRTCVAVNRVAEFAAHIEKYRMKDQP